MKASWFLVGFGVLVIAGGVRTMVDPLGLERLSERFLTERGFGVAVVLRLVVGAIMWFSAAASRTPRALKVLGGLVFVSGIALAAIGLGRLQAIVAWGAGLEPNVLRADGLATALFGLFIIWSVWPRRSNA